MRITEASIARAFDHGENALAIEALLRSHSTKDVPQSLVYLVHDVERRRSRLSIVNAATVATIIVSDDAALVAQAVRVSAAKLEAVGAHAATSALAPARVEAALAAKGVLGVVVSGRARAAPAKGAGSKVGVGSADSPAAAAAAARSAARSTSATAALLRAAAEQIDGSAAMALARSIRNPEK